MRKKHPLLWCREAMEAHRLLPPNEVAGQACWCCGRQAVETMFGWQPKLVEIMDAYSRLVLCMDCLTQHMPQLKEPQGKGRLKGPAKKRRLPTYEEWAATATISEVEVVLESVKKRMKGGNHANS